jgi:hypothetical protein
MAWGCEHKRKRKETEMEPIWSKSEQTWKIKCNMKINKTEIDKGKTTRFGVICRLSP